jgi:hypothetical protein
MPTSCSAPGFPTARSTYFHQQETTQSELGIMAVPRLISIDSADQTSFLQVCERTPDSIWQTQCSCLEMTSRSDGDESQQLAKSKALSGPTASRATLEKSGRSHGSGQMCLCYTTQQGIPRIWSDISHSLDPFTWQKQSVIYLPLFATP